MPQRAFVNEKEVFAFTYADNEWDSLREDKKRKAIMTCCDAKAIPKISVLGNFFFAHNHGQKCDKEYTSYQEELKFTVGKLLYDMGLNVKAEFSYETIEADIYFEDKYKNRYAINFTEPNDFEEEIVHYDKYHINVYWLLKNTKKALAKLPGYLSVLQFKKGEKGYTTLKLNTTLTEVVYGIAQGEASVLPRLGSKVTVDIMDFNSSTQCGACNAMSPVFVGCRIHNSKRQNIWLDLADSFEYLQSISDEVPLDIYKEINTWDRVIACRYCGSQLFPNDNLLNSWHHYATKTNQGEVLYSGMQTCNRVLQKLIGVSQFKGVGLQKYR